MPIRNLLALMMVGLMVVPGALAEEAAESEEPSAAADETEATEAPANQTEAASSFRQDDLLASVDLSKLDPDSLLCLLTELTIGECLGVGFVDVDYGPGYAGAGTCPGQTDCAVAPALWINSGRVELGHVIVCANLSASC